MKLCLVFLWVGHGACSFSVTMLVFPGSWQTNGAVHFPRHLQQTASRRHWPSHLVLLPQAAFSMPAALVRQPLPSRCLYQPLLPRWLLSWQVLLQALVASARQGPGLAMRVLSWSVSRAGYRRPRVGQAPRHPRLRGSLAAGAAGCRCLLEQAARRLGW